MAERQTEKIIVHYIWIGGEDIPHPYLLNYQKCISLNQNDFTFMIWRNNDCISLLNQYNLFEYWSKLTFICKCNFLKYLILDKFGGIYTDFDITWKQPFFKIFNEFNYPINDIIITALNTDYLDKNNQVKWLLDDPFIISKPGIFGECIEYCMNRSQLKIDGEIFLKTGQQIQHKLEPIGPFGLTEWMYINKYKYSIMLQKGKLDNNGHFGIHTQQTNWKKF